MVAKIKALSWQEVNPFKKKSFFGQFLSKVKYLQNAKIYFILTYPISCKYLYLSLKFLYLTHLNN